MVPEEFQQFIGRVDPPHVRDVERGAIKRYTEAAGDDNPLYYDNEFASRSEYGGIIAPPGFFGWPIKSVPNLEAVMGLMSAVVNAGYYRMLDGGMAFEFFNPVYPGDILVASPKIMDVSGKEGKGGLMIICHFETSYVKQNGDLVAKSFQKVICRKPQPGGAQ
ncbi:MAG: MaoC family dehydratase N-terminal domain-containing protein [Dehalococcoidia bacterium]|nr:MaoC family dehydratase N-terminal domain-containing protein [Dehalococcoidia bacterium]